MLKGFKNSKLPSDRMQSVKTLHPIEKDLYFKTMGELVLWTNIIVY